MRGPEQPDRLGGIKHVSASHRVRAAGRAVVRFGPNRRAPEPVFQTFQGRHLAVVPGAGKRQCSSHRHAIPLRLSEELTTKGKKLNVGQRVRWRRLDVLLKASRQFPSAARRSARSPMFATRACGANPAPSRCDHSVNINGRQIRLNGAFDDKGKAGGGRGRRDRSFSSRRFLHDRDQRADAGRHAGSGVSR